MYILNHKSISLFILLIGNFSFLFKSHSQTINPKSANKGKVIFEVQCGSCHGISAGNFGPKLGGVLETRTQKELYDFVKYPAKYIKNGDARAKALFEKYKTEMPSYAHLKDDDIKNIFEYIKQQTVFQKVSTLTISELIPKNATKRYSPPIKPSKLSIELEDFITLPKLPNTPDDKGLATLRVHPSDKEIIFVSDQMGIIYQVKNKMSDVYFDIRKCKENFVHTPGIGTGLGSFDFHPDFANNGLFYTTHAEKYLGKPAINDKVWADSIGVGLQWVITEWKAKNTSIVPFEGENREVLRFNTPTTAHGGQDLTFVPNISKDDKDYGLLYLGIGDGGSNNIKMPELCHSSKSLLGTIIRINPQGNNGIFSSYGIPSDNPFADSKEPKIQKEIYALGFRNPHRMAWSNNKQYVADIGEANVEEINLVAKGGDYGWSSQEGSYGISTKLDKTIVFEIPESEKNKYLQPIAQYDHNEGNAVCGGFVYKGYLKELIGKYVFGDIVNGRLFYANLEKNGDIYEVSILSNNKETSLKEIINQKRVHLRIGYNESSGDLFIMTKPDNTIRRIKSAFLKP
jgi:cytochrome c2